MANSLAWVVGNATAWTPASEASLLGWWKADSLSLSDGDPVSSWSDSSSSGYTMTQAGTQRPTYKTNIKNGLPAVIFDPNFGQVLNSSMPADTKPFTMAAVIESAEFSTRYQSTFAANSDGGLQVFTRIEGAIEADVQNVAVIGAPSYTLNNGSWYIIIFSYENDGTWNARVNGSSQTNSSSTSFTGGTTTTMGAKGDTGNGLSGYIGEIMKFSSFVNFTTIDTYLNGRWAVH